MTNEDFVSKLIRQLGMDNRRKTVRSLLAGNDAQCFTSEQYARAYHKLCHKDDPQYKDNWIKWLITLAPKHLKSVGMREVSPGVWALPERSDR